MKYTPGYVGADIQTLCKEASTIAVQRIIGSNQDIDELEQIYIEKEDFIMASKKVKPSAQREGFSTVPSTTWGDIGALVSEREEL